MSFQHSPLFGALGIMCLCLPGFVHSSGTFVLRSFRLYLTLLVANTKGEISFSVLKRVNNKLRSTVGHGKKNCVTYLSWPLKQTWPTALTLNVLFQNLPKWNLGKGNAGTVRYSLNLSSNVQYHQYTEDYFRSFVLVRWLHHLHDCWFIVGHAPLLYAQCTMSMCYNGTSGTPQNIVVLYRAFLAYIGQIKALIRPCR